MSVSFKSHVTMQSCVLAHALAAAIGLAAMASGHAQSLLQPGTMQNSAASLATVPLAPATFADVTGSLPIVAKPVPPAMVLNTPTNSDAPASADAPMSAKTETALAPAQTEVAGAQNPEQSVTTLRFLPNNAQGLRLAGEIAASEWPIYLTKAQSQADLQFQLGYLSAVSNLPEASQLTVEINDFVIGHAQIDAPGNVKKVLFRVPVTILKPGFNSLRIIAEHRHRADCSLPATFELWTQIDATATGFIIPRQADDISLLDDLPAVPPNRDGAMPIRAVLPGSTTTAAIERTLQAVQLVAIRGRFEQPLVDIGADLARGPGINVAVGTLATLAKIDGLAPLTHVDGPALILQPGTAKNRATLIVTGKTSADVDTALLQLSHFATGAGSPQGLRAARAFPGYAVTGGARIKLRDLGIISQQFSGRMFRASFSIVMPSDFYPADIAKVDLNLSGAYAAKLSLGSQIVISVNDKIVVGSPIARASGEVFKDRLISFPLGMLQPGLNKITIEAQVPAPIDATCDPLNASQAEKRFLLLDNSELFIPELPRVALSPNLAVTSTGGFPYASLIKRPHLFIPNPDPETLAAAATMITRMAVSAGRSIAFKLDLTEPKPDAGATLMIGVASTFSSKAMAMAGLEPARMKSIWQDGGTPSPDGVAEKAVSRYARINAEHVALERNFPAECRLQLPPRGSAPSTSAARVATSRAAFMGREAPPLAVVQASAPDLDAEWQKKLNGEGSWWPKISLPHIDRQIFTDLEDIGIAGLTKAEARILAGFVPQQVPSVITNSANLLMAQSSNGSSGNGIWTIVTAPTAHALEDSMACLVDPRVWNQVRGAISALDTGKAMISSVSAQSPHFIATQSFTLSNARLIAAGWFSHNLWAFIGSVLVTAVTLATMTRLFVQNVGRRS